MKMECITCKYWEANIAIINSALVMSNNHGLNSNVKVATYCMYCGSILFDSEKVKEANK